MITALYIFCSIALILWFLHRVFYYVLRQSGDTFWILLRRYYAPGPYCFLVLTDLAVKLYAVLGIIYLTVKLWQRF